jgi:hypothetical protein
MSAPLPIACVVGADTRGEPPDRLGRSLARSELLPFDL